MSVVNQVFDDNTNFTIIGDRFDFFTANDACQSLSPPGLLASFADVEEFNFVVQTIGFIQNVPDEPNFFWTGLIREPGRSVRARNFVFLDGTRNRFDRDGVFPWREGEPNNNGGNQFCTIIGRGLDFTGVDVIDDVRCDGQSAGPNGGAICKQSNKIIVEVANEKDYSTTLWILGVLICFSIGLLAYKYVQLKKLKQSFRASFE